MWKRDAWWGVVPPLDLHQDTDTPTQTQIYYLRQSYMCFFLFVLGGVTPTQVELISQNQIRMEDYFFRAFTVTLGGKYC